MSNILTGREEISFPTRAIQAASALPPMARKAAALLGSGARNLSAGLEAWSESRKLQALPDPMLKDIGVSRGGVDRAVRHGRDTDRLGRLSGKRDLAMWKFTFSIAALIGVALLSSSANACSDIAPSYIGARSADPEKETYGYVLKPGKQQLLGFVGPARQFGAVTGDVEKDTIAYRWLLVPSPSLETTHAHKHAGQ